MRIIFISGWFEQRGNLVPASYCPAQRIVRCSYCDASSSAVVCDVRCGIDGEEKLVFLEAFGGEGCSAWRRSLLSRGSEPAL